MITDEGFVLTEVDSVEGGIGLTALLHLMYGFFFSSRRRHTRCSRDWSSDVCSSDLATSSPLPFINRSRKYSRLLLRAFYLLRHHTQTPATAIPIGRIPRLVMPTQLSCEIGRASCRERV